MKTIEIGDDSYRDLQQLRTEWFCCKGDKPKPDREIVEKLIKQEINKMFPIKYQTSGFDRQD